MYQNMKRMHVHVQDVPGPCFCSRDHYFEQNSAIG